MASDEGKIPEAPRPSRGGQPNAQLLEGAQKVPYKTIGGEDLYLYLFEPEEDGETPSDPADRPARPAVLFFFSSFWDNGAIGQFAPHCALLAARGMVAMAVEYRVSGRNKGASPTDSIADARSAFRWVRMNAEALRVDPNRVAGAGGAGGATLPVGAAFLSSIDDPGEDTAVSCRPDALILFSPILDLSKKGAGLDRFADPKLAKAIDPLRNVSKLGPPAIILHGGADQLVPIRGSEIFARRMRRKKNPCELVRYEGQGHTFYNFNVSMEMYEGTMHEVDRFLVEHGFLAPSGEETGSSLVA